MDKNIKVLLTLPDGLDENAVRTQIPLIASNLLVASETIKTRMLKEQNSYEEEDVYKLLFDNWSFWMDLLTRSLDRA